MRPWIIWLAGIAAVAASGVVVFSQGPAPAPPGRQPAATAPQPARDLSKLSPAQRALYASARRGADWLQRRNRQDGRFGYVSTTALGLRTENDHYLRQASAAVALAEAARSFRDDRAAALATQSVLTLLLTTAPDDPRKPQLRYTTVPPGAVNRLASAGLLVRAIHELPAPAADLLAQADQLCNYIRSRQRADGSLSGGDSAPEAKAPADETAAAAAYAAEGLHGLMCSHRQRPAPWKLELVGKAAGHYVARWRANKSVGVVPPLTATLTEAYLATRQQALADAVLEMNDWLAGLQYAQVDPLQPLWVGGFMGWADDKPARQPPDAGAAGPAASLAAACRVARQLGDARRHARYREALERALQFLTTLQYHEGNTGHFADWYRAELVGAFHTSHQDGDLRLDHTARAVAALLHYLALELD